MCCLDQDTASGMECIKMGGLRAARSGLPAQTSPGQATSADLSPSSLPIVNLMRQTTSKQDVSGRWFARRHGRRMNGISGQFLSGFSFYGVVRQAQTLVAWVGNETRIFPILSLTSGHFEQVNTLFPLQVAPSILVTLASNLQDRVRRISYSRY